MARAVEGGTIEFVEIVFTARLEKIPNSYFRMLEHSNAVFFQKSRGGSEVPKSSSDPDFYCYVKTKAEKNAFKQQKQSKISAKKQSKTTNGFIYQRRVAQSSALEARPFTCHMGP